MEIISVGALIPTKEHGTDIKIHSIQDNTIVFEACPKNNLAGLAFFSKGDWFDIDIHFQGKRRPENVFLGGNCWIPDRLPIRIIDNAPHLEPCGDLYKYVSDNDRINMGLDSINNKQVASQEEKPPHAIKDNEDRRSGSTSLRIPDYKKDWPPVEPPVLRFNKRSDPSEPKYQITVVYDVARDKVISTREKYKK